MADTYVPSQSERDLISKIQKRWGECQGAHTQFERSYERRERVYHGTLETASDAAKWRHKLHPAYAFNLVETIISNTVEQGLRMDVRPSPQVNLSLDEATQMLQQTEAVADLLQHEHRVDGMDMKQRPFFLTQAIGGRGVGKSYWNYTERSTRRQGVQDVAVHDDDGSYLGTVPTVTEIVEHGVFRDHSTFEVLDPRDFIVHEAAASLNPFEPHGAQYVFHRCWYSFEQLKMLEASGFLKNVDYLKESKNSSDDPAYRSTDIFKANAAKDMIEVWEYWCMEAGEVHRVIQSGNGVILRDASLASGRAGDPEKSPFWHGLYPFTVCSSMPQPFTTIGKSEIELVEELQAMIWEMANQRFDNIELINNFITLIRDDVEDPEQFEFFPGARWLVQNPQDVEILQPPYQLAQVTLEAEALLRGDLQNVTSSAPFASGTQSASVDQKTATGASIVMNAAQQRLIAKKWQTMGGIVDEANIRIQNCQQFLDQPRLAHLIGKDGALRFHEIDPLEIQGTYYAELNPESDSNMRQERRAEATQFFQVLIAAAPLMAAAGKPLNLEELIKWYGSKWDIADVERFLSADPAAAGAMMAPAPSGGGAPPAGPPQQGGAPNLGITAAPSPGADVGIGGSPVTDLQRALTMGGGDANAPSITGR